MSEISVSNKNKPPSETNSCIYNNHIYMISLDDVVSDCTKDKIPYSRRKCDDCFNIQRCKSNFHHSSVDGLFTRFNGDYFHFFLFEFKKYNIRDSEEISGYEIRELNKFYNDIKEYLEQTCPEKDEHYKKIIKKAKKKLRNKEKDLLKLKSYETIYSIIPHMYIEYCRKNKKPYDTESIKSFLLNCKFSLYLVYNYRDLNQYPNKSGIRKYQHNSRDCVKDVFNLQRIRDFNFHDVDIIAGPIDFESTYNDISY